jgi:UDP-N-acetylmuramoyl-tripeptide--D-alanyl-D-alanine ligase
MAPADWTLVRHDMREGAGVAQAQAGGQRLLYKVAAPGRHVALNALAALAVADALGADRALAAVDIATWRPPAGRGTRARIAMDPLDETAAFDLIDDAFNANPASMAAALAVLAAAEPRDGAGRIAKGRRIAILGDMLELGPDEARMHAEIADHPAMRVISRVHCVGPRMRALWAALPEATRGDHVGTAAELAARAHRLVDPGDVVLVKGSKGSRVSLVVDALRKLGQADAADAAGE